MAFSSVQMAVDFYYVSRHRRDFLEQRITIINALRSQGFLASFGGGLTVGALAAAAILATSRDGDKFPLEYVMLIAGLQVSIAISTVPQQILYWQHCERKMLGIEIAFWIIILAGVGLLKVYAANLEGGLILIIAVAVFRMWCLIFTAYRLQNQVQSN